MRFISLSLIAALSVIATAASGFAQTRTPREVAEQLASGLFVAA